MGIVATRNLPHLLFVGPCGAGKRTRVNALLRELYGHGVDVVKVESRTVASLKINVTSSKYHMRLRPSDAEDMDQDVVNEVVNEIAAYPPLGGHPFKVVVIQEADALSVEAQAALRVTMERYAKTCRFILTCVSASLITPALHSHCATIRVPAPAVKDMQGVMAKIAAAEKLALPADVAARIAITSNGDLRKALLTVQSIARQGGKFTSETPLPAEPMAKAMDVVVAMILKQQTPGMATKIHEKIDELMVICCLSVDSILKGLCFQLSAQVPNKDLKERFLAAATHFSQKLAAGGEAMLHLDAFILRVMSEYQAHVTANKIEDATSTRNDCDTSSARNGGGATKAQIGESARNDSDAVNVSAAAECNAK